MCASIITIAIATVAMVTIQLEHFDVSTDRVELVLVLSTLPAMLSATMLPMAE